MAVEIPVTEAGVYEVFARYREFSETKTVEVKEGEEVLVEFRWYTKPPTPPTPPPTVGKIIVRAYVDDVEVAPEVSVRKIG